MSKFYFRPLVQSGPIRPERARSLAGGNVWFTDVEVIQRRGPSQFAPISQLSSDVLDRLTSARDPIAGVSFEEPKLMGILNVTPDSFSDGGQFVGAAAALARARDMVEGGADILDIGGESTRPGAVAVPFEAELARVTPVLEAIRSEMEIPVSVDTRKSQVAAASLELGADLINDVSGFTFDSKLAPICADQGAPVCVMHAQGAPETMQDDPQYDNVVLDVYDFLEERVAALEALGVARSKIIVDPGIGFGKNVEHNLALLQNLSVFHGLGCAILLGVSRKGFIRVLGGADDPMARMPGSIAVGLAGIAQGVQILRVHDVIETKQAIRLWQATTGGVIA